jgi:hypothetical protein
MAQFTLIQKRLLKPHSVLKHGGCNKESYNEM